MAKNVVLLVCFVIMILDVIAGVLGIEAEIAQNKVEELRLWILECRDPIKHQTVCLYFLLAV
ncbi:hypothetical protein Leryth_023436 [Lithospermum erythrorhizon]|nr:hypothetical protein Leryth_023436 [Lithospermum erythrorhizon]